MGPDPRGTVFVVDDDPDVRRSLSLSLSKRGFEVATFDCAEAFLAAVEPDRRGCLILDVAMPGMDGLELQERLARTPYHLPIVFITGHGNIPMSVKAVKGGAVDFLEKPYRQEVLVERIEEALAEDARAHQERLRAVEIRRRFDQLTARERQVLRCLVADPASSTSKHIARQLDISPRTVDDHRARIMAKMQSRSLTELADMVRLCTAEG